MLAKGLIEPHRMSVAFAKKFVMMLFIVSILCVYEFRMGMTPWIVLRRFYPDQGLEWYTIFRYGLARVAGPYGHAILAGLLLAIAFRLQRWIQWSGQWEPRFRGLKWLKISKSRLIALVILGGMIMTLERGPWLGAVVGACAGRGGTHPTSEGCAHPDRGDHHRPSEYRRRRRSMHMLP